MIRRHIIISVAAAGALLAACGGKKDSNPTPTPTASPTPTPTASPTYSAFPLGAAAEFATINASTSFTGDPATTAVTLGVAGTEGFSSRVRLATSNVVATGTYVFRENTEETRFESATPLTPSAIGNTEFVFRKEDTATPGKFSQIEFLNNVIPGTVSNDPVFGSLTRVSYGNWYRGDSTVGAKRLTYAVFGYPTVASDMPTSGTAEYGTRVTGRLVSVTSGPNAATSILNVSGSVSTTINFSTGLVDLFLYLDTIGTITAQGAIPAGTSQFSGSFTTGSPLSGTITGGFFGSQGLEIGIVFAGSGTVGGANKRLVGEIVGKKN